MKRILFTLLTLSLLNCSNTSTPNINDSNDEAKSTPTSAEFNAYWYAGKAELCRYELEQARYGEMRKGNAVLVFVTEPFSKQKQVKLDNPEANPKDVSNVLKLNFTKKFDTGIYPYSLMTSSFTPVDASDKTLKINCSVQEWCGHVFTQLNREKKNYVAKSYSYFESEGDKTEQLGDVLCEDGIWTNLRINPSQLPIGKMKMLPALSYLRLKHKPMAAVEATASISQAKFNEKSVNQYLMQFEDRNVKIYYDEKFPYTIQGWEETYKDGNTDLTTRGTLKKVLLSDYWSHNHNTDDAMREDFYK
jgi:hypothetical protein